MTMKLAIMQPYFFPYLGYFQLMAAVDFFLIFDDVHFIKKGWIHRNYILLNQAAHPFTLPIQKMSQNRLILDHERANPKETVEQQLLLLYHAYHKAPYYAEVMPHLERMLRNEEPNVARYLGHQLETIRDYLGLDTVIHYTSSFENEDHLKKEARLLDLCNRFDAHHYINPIGGKALYDDETFERAGVHLEFLEMQPLSYRQFGDVFVPNLSIIDVLMFNPRARVQQLLDTHSFN